MIILKFLTSLSLLFWLQSGFVIGFNTNELEDLIAQSTSYLNDSSASIKGVSIGGWLVTEPYITPSLYQKAFNIVSELGNTNTTGIVDEYTLAEVLGYERAQALLEEHFDTWITEEDFKQISEDGFNLVRIPIGYWAWKQDNVSSLYVGNITFQDPYISSGLQLKYLSDALTWATQYNLSVWIDLHGAPNTQNGFDNSGQRNLYGDLSWLKTPESRQLTLAIWDILFDSYLTQEAVVGIEIINEPLSPKLDSFNMTQYYYKAYKLYTSKNSSDADSTFVIHDAFEDIGYWNLHFNSDFKNVSGIYNEDDNLTFYSSNVMVDHHHYEVFTDFQLNNSQYDRITDIINYGESILKEELSFHPALVGEFSAAITDCATWVNGVGIGARYDGSYYRTTNFTTDYNPMGTCQSHMPIADWTQDYKDRVRQFVEAQLAVYSKKTNGWIFWNWKTENAAEWDYLKLKENGLFPIPLDNYTYFQSNGDMKPNFSSSLAPPPQSSASSLAKSSTSAPSTSKKNDAVSVRLCSTFPLIAGMNVLWQSCVLALIAATVALFLF